MQKGFAPILIILLLAILTLFVPIPYYLNEDSHCLQSIEYLECKPKAKGWYFGPSLWSQLSGNLQWNIPGTVQPSPTSENAEGKFCGGLAANLPEYQCPTGYKCQLDGNYPDAAGKCVKR